MDCLAKCVDVGQLLGQKNEFGPNLNTWSPLSLSEIRARQEFNNNGPKYYKIGHPSKPPITLRYGWLCQRGLYPDDPDKENQDSFKIIPAFDGEERTILMGVFDGHGEYGDDCSRFVRDNIEEYLIQARKDHNRDLEKSFRSAFRQLNSAMHYQQVRIRQLPLSSLRSQSSLLQLRTPAPPERRAVRLAQDFSDLLSGTTACVAFFEKSAVWVRSLALRATCPEACLAVLGQGIQ